MARPIHLDLCSGIGGFAIASEIAGYKTAGFCEIEPFARRVLRYHWPEVPIHDDITTLTGEIIRGWSDRVDPMHRQKLAALGNAIVPEVAARILLAMREADLDTPRCCGV